MATDRSKTISEEVRRAAKTLARKTSALNFSPPVAFVYNPLEYAMRAHVEYIQRFAAGRKKTIFLGMNPGPFGMAQTGVPFGEISYVRDWMGINTKIDRPPREHPKRPVEGFACRRSEVSGKRLWGLFAELYDAPEKFFADHYVANYCPLVFMSATGANITPDKIPAAESAPLFQACDEHLRRVVAALEPRFVIGVGKFAEKRAQGALGDMNRVPEIVSILHPSPASPAANKDWAGATKRRLRELGAWK